MGITSTRPISACNWNKGILVLLSPLWFYCRFSHKGDSWPNLNLALLCITCLTACFRNSIILGHSLSLTPTCILDLGAQNFPKVFSKFSLGSWLTKTSIQVVLVLIYDDLFFHIGTKGCWFEGSPHKEWQFFIFVSTNCSRMVLNIGLK